MRAVRSAIWTSGEPVSPWARWKSETIFDLDAISRAMCVFTRVFCQSEAADYTQSRASYSIKIMRMHLDPPTGGDQPARRQAPVVLPLRQAEEAPGP